MDDVPVGRKEKTRVMRDGQELVEDTLPREVVEGVRRREEAEDILDFDVGIRSVSSGNRLRDES